jgi:STE24 endopeptidase
MVNGIAWIVLTALLLDFGLHWVADRLNLKAWPASPPKALRSFYADGEFDRSQTYLRARTRFGWLTDGTQLAAVLLFWFAGGFPALDAWVRSFGWGPIFSGLLFIGVLAALRFLLTLPFSAYSTFVIEAQYGFNRTSWRTFWADRIRGMVLGVVLGAPLVAGILFFFQAAGPLAWAYSWAAATLFMLVVHYIAPTWIMPLFNRFEPLADANLENAIRTYADTIEFPIRKVFVMDGSKRSGKGNAFFTGFGRHKRIVLFDTLIQQHDQDELVAILAHEMGHFKKHHILIGLVTGILQTGVLFYLLSFCIGYPPLFEAFFMPQPSIYAGLVLFGLLYAPVDFFTGLLAMAVSRRNEYAADRFAVATTGRGQPLVRALTKLAVHHLSHVTPHPFYVFLNYSHPPVLRRIEAIREASG